jgi:hypothetical protein
MPEIQINFMAVAVAVIANFFFGFLWYTPLFGKVWAKEMGLDITEKPPAGAMAKGMILMVIGNFLMAYVLAHDLTVWNPEFWGMGPMEGSKAMFAVIAAFFLWLGYFVPQDLNRVAWEKGSWKLFLINTSYHFLSLVLVGMILVHM